ncbi:DUF4190 domain-containing protein [Streptomyces sp. NPDC089919]|uniref:DUF4190 domain-containing protein n=1 Tax=Streptomyces sp. NPDC089919 TaxID=3155188 RepID=UPI003427336F
MSEENREAGARDPWAPPEAPKVPLEKQGGATGAAPSVHDQPTMAQMPGAEPFGYGSGPAQQPPGPAYAPPVGQSGPDPAYGYPGFPPQGPPGYQQAPPGYPQGPPPGYQGYPGYPGYAHGGWGAPQPRNAFGVTALVLGILSVLIFCSSVFAVVMGITAIVFGFLGRGRAKRGEATNGGQALAGIILGAVGVVLGIAMFALIIAGVVFGGADVDSQYDEDPPSLSTSLVVP